MKEDPHNWAAFQEDWMTFETYDWCERCGAPMFVRTSRTESPDGLVTETSTRICSNGECRGEQG